MSDQTLSALDIVQIPAFETNYIYLLRDQQSGLVAAVDPADPDLVLKELNQRGWVLSFILNTHHHHDHVGGNIQLKQQTSCQIIGAQKDAKRIPLLDIGLSEGEYFDLGDSRLLCLETDGHTIGHIIYYCPIAGALFCGDTLFSMGCGRLFEGSAAQMWQSLQKIKQLPKATKIYCAHEYSWDNARFSLAMQPDNQALQHQAQRIERLRTKNLPTIPSLLADECEANLFLTADLDEFTRLRQIKDHWHG